MQDHSREGHQTAVGGIICPTCESDTSSVLDTRQSLQGIRRRRQCDECGTRFTTMEIRVTSPKAKFKRLKKIVEMD